MKKILALLISLVLLAGCITVVEQQESIEEVPPAPVKEIIVKETVTSPGIIEEPEEPAEEQPVLSPALAALKTKADAKVKSYSFLDAPPPDNLGRDTWYIKGHKIRIMRFIGEYFNPESHYDNIYLDAKEKTAYGYCESEEEGICPIRNKRFILDYNELMVQTPYQIVKSIPYGEIITSELLWDRMYQVASYLKEGIKYKIWIDSFSGLAARVEKYNPDDELIDRHDFRKIQINNVEDATVEPPKF